MNAKKAKALRRMVYGSGEKPQDFIRTKSGKIIANPMRRIYQKMKKATKGVSR